MKKQLLTILMLITSFNCAFAYKKSSLDIVVEGQTRNMVVFTPDKTKKKMPLMIVTHGMNQNPEYQMENDKMYEMVDTAKFVLTYLRSDGNTWDTQGKKDQNFVLQTIDEMYAKYKIDRNRVYWTGFSMGSMLMYHSMPFVQDKIAAFAPTSGVQFMEQPWNNCGKPVNLIQCHAYADDVFVFDRYRIHDYVEHMAKMNESTTYIKLPDYSPWGGLKGDKEVWTNVNTGCVVELFAYHNGGHSPQHANSVEIWNFCKRFTLKDTKKAPNVKKVVLKTGEMEQPAKFDPDFHIYLCFGQSNMEGNAPIEYQDCEKVDPRFRMMAAVDMKRNNRTKGNWYVAYPPLCRENNGLTPADYFGRTMVEKLPKNIKVGVINVAVGGCSINLFDEDKADAYIAGAADWLKGFCRAYDNNPFRRLVECAKEAQKVGVIKGILLHQGCTDNTQPDWPDRVNLVYTRLLKELGLQAKDCPLLIGELLQKDKGGICHAHNAVIARTPQTIPTAHVVSSADCSGAPDGLHFTAEGYRLLGKRYAEVMLSILNAK